MSRGPIPDYSARSSRRGRRPAFTLIELLVVVAIIGMLVSILLPTLAAARRSARSTQCLSRLHVFGHGTSMYTQENRDVFPPSRLPKYPGEDCEPAAHILGGLKYRPTFAAMMSQAVGAPPFDDPQHCKDSVDLYGEDGDRQDYSYESYVCPDVGEWTDERNGSYGYNYQFLGNSRLLDESNHDSYKNWGVQTTDVQDSSRTVLAGDCLGTAASWAPAERLEYENNAKDEDRLGNEGFNLDPPWVDPANGEMAEFDGSPQARTAADPRHDRMANILWSDAHASPASLRQLGYRLEEDASIGFNGENSLWTPSGQDLPWTLDYAR